MSHAHHPFVSTFIALAAVASVATAQAQSYPQSSSQLTSQPGVPADATTNDPSRMSDTPAGTTAPAGASVYDNSGNSASTPVAFDPPAAGSRHDDGYSWLPYTTRGYIGVSGGQAKLGDLACSPFYSCDDSSNRVIKVYTGGMFNEYLGLELAYFNTGNIDRSGGRVRAHGGNLSLLAQAPLGPMAAVYAKVGATYAWTKTSVGPLAVGIPSGDESDAGPSYGVGLRLNASRNWAFVLEWERHSLKFAGDDKNGTKLTTLGVQYRF